MAKTQKQTPIVADALRALECELHELEFVSGVERRLGPISSLDFLRDYVSRNKPVILTHCVDDWPCIQKWTEEYLCATIGEKSVSVALTPYGRADAVTVTTDLDGENEKETECFAEPHETSMEFNHFVEHLKDKMSLTVPYLQQQNDNLRGTFPELHQDVALCGPSWAAEAFGCNPEAVNLWIGDERSATSFHKDHYENIYIVVQGSKQFTLLPPCSGQRLHYGSYPHAIYEPDANGELVARLLSPRAYIDWSPIELGEGHRNKWPRFYSNDDPPPLTCTLCRGEILYLPSLWYHHVAQQNNDGSMTIAVNYWYDMQFDIKFAYHQFINKLQDSMK